MDNLLTELPNELDFALQLNERTYPMSDRHATSNGVRWLPDNLPARSSEASNELSQVQQPSAAATSVFQSLWSSLPMSRHSRDDFVQPKEVVKCFSDSHKALRHASAELRSMFETMCRVTLESRRHPELDQQKQAEIEAAHIDKCLDHDFPNPLPGPEFRAAAVVGDPAEIFDRLLDQLHETTREFVDGLFSLLDQLVDKELVGLIRWFSDDTCRFYSFHTRIVHEVGTVERRNIRQEHEVKNYTGDRPFPHAKLVREYKKDITTKNGQHVFEQIRHDQQLIDATIHEIGDPAVIVPLDIYSRFMPAVPKWLRPALRIVTGDCFRELFIRKQLRIERSAETTVEESVEYHFCPAVILGDFVLLAWGEIEHNRENYRREQVRQRNAARKGYICLSSLAWLACLAGVILFSSSDASTVGAVVLGVGVIFQNLSFHRFLAAIPKKPTFEYYALQNVGVFLFLAIFLSIPFVVAMGAPKWLSLVIACCLYGAFTHVQATLFRLVGMSPVALFSRQEIA